MMIAEAEHGPLVDQLLAQLEHLVEENRSQAGMIQQMRDEVALLKVLMEGNPRV